MSDKTFTWTAPDGTVIALPSLRHVKAGVIRRNRRREPVDAMFSIIEELADEATLAAVDDLDSEDLNDLVGQWQADGGGLGESSGSST